MSRMKLVFLFLTTILLSYGFAQENMKRTLTLKECEALALSNNMTIQDAKLGVEFSKARRTQASHAKILPKFQLRNIWGPIPPARALFTETGVLTSPDTAVGFSDLGYFTDLDISFIQPIFTFGKLSSVSSAAHFGVLVEEANLERKQEDVRFKVRQLYWALVLGKELLAVVEDAKKELSKAESKIEEKLDEGSDEVSQTDLFKLQIFKYQTNKKDREALDNIQLTKSALRTTLGMENDYEFDVATEYLDPVDVELDELPAFFEIALQNRPELTQLRAGLNVRRALVAVSKSDYYPHFFFGAQLKYNFAKDRFDSSNPFVYNPTNFLRPGFLVGANMNLNFLQTRDKVRLAEVEYRRLSQKENLLIEGIKLDVQKTYLFAKQSKTNMRESRRALKASDNWLRSVSMTFDIGVGEVKDLIDAFKANGAMQAEHLQNIFKYNTVIAKLSKVIGRDLYE